MTHRAEAGPGLAAPAGVRYGSDGLVPGIVQDVSGQVRMLGYLDAEALAATLETGIAHFHSRSRGALWRKGETSGNELRVLRISTDCDLDALLLEVEPAGPTCHTGRGSCFDPPDAGDEVVLSHARSTEGFAWLETLWQIVIARLGERPDGSYTARLVASGPEAVARKVTEEAIEVLLAARDDEVAAGTSASADRVATQDALASELGDLLFHALVLAAERGLPPSRVIEVLKDRHAGRVSPPVGPAELGLRT